MVTVGVLARLEAKPGKEQEVASFLEGALPLAQQEAATAAWFAIRLGPSTFGIFDVFPETGRKAHLEGPIAAALMQNADELLSEARRSNKWTSSRASSRSRSGFASAPNWTVLGKFPQVAGMCSVSAPPREASTRRLSEAPAPLTVRFFLGCRLRHSRIGVNELRPGEASGAVT
jgi:quinol monooxygenase YgiN